MSLFKKKKEKYVQVKKDECRECGKCNNVCPVHLKIYDGLESNPNAGCLQCEICINECKYGVLFANKRF